MQKTHVRFHFKNYERPLYENIFSNFKMYWHGQVHRTYNCNNDRSITLISLYCPYIVSRAFLNIER